MTDGKYPDTSSSGFKLTNAGTPKTKVFKAELIGELIGLTEHWTYIFKNASQMQISSSSSVLWLKYQKFLKKKHFTEQSVWYW